jgi:hypothetical protein
MTADTHRKRQVHHMTGIASRLRGLSSLVALAVIAVFATASAASAQQVSAQAEVLSVTEAGDFIDVQLKVSVTNSDSADASNVFVFFEDGLNVGLGDVAPSASAVSQTQTRTIDTSQHPSRNLALPVTLKYRFNGRDVEQKGTLYVRRPTAPGGVQ